jgi:hypothetical protein
MDRPKYLPPHSLMPTGQAFVPTDAKSSAQG